MTLVETQELLNSLGARFIVYVNNEDPTGCIYLMLKIYHSEGDGTTLMVFGINGLNGTIIPSRQKDKEKT